jgi:AcrR family transcriptional regulator
MNGMTSAGSAADTAPVDTALADTAPTDTALADTAPTDTAPTDTALDGAALVDTALDGTALDGTAPADGAVAEAGQERKAPGRPRNAQADEAILDAVLAMLNDGQSPAAISVEAVAARAGVGKATIYRRWPNKEALLLDAVRAMKGPLPEPAGRSVREDLIALITANRSGNARRNGRITACLLPELIRDEELGRMYRAVVEPRREVMRGVLRRGIETGELRADLNVEITLLMLNGPSMVQSMLSWDPGVPLDDFAATLVDAVLRGAAA